MTDKSDTNIQLELQLGDIILIKDPVNEKLNERTFFIDYIDNDKIILIDTETLSKTKLTINDEGILGDGHITNIGILSRADSPSFARQNGLLPGKWINIYFGGDIPAILTGEITNLEDDMIEVTTVDGDIIYINFAYKGIPEDLPIDQIEIRNPPTIQEKQKQKEEEDVEAEEKELSEKEEGEKEVELEDKDIIPELEEEKMTIPPEEIQMTLPVQDIKNKLREFIIRADQIQFGDERLGPIAKYVDRSKKQQRYSIEEQVSDLLDDILSTVPNNQRTPKVLNNIHTMIERFKQLREQFSSFDKYGNVENKIIKEATYKPLSKWLNEFNINLYWILPVVKNIKKIYDLQNHEENSDDVVVLNMNDNINEMKTLFKTYYSNTSSNESNKYNTLYSELTPYLTPFNMIGDEEQSEVLIEKEVNTNINTVIDNLENMYSSVFNNNNLRNRRFVITKYNLSESKLDVTEMTNSKMVAVRVPLTTNDVMAIKSIVTLPEPTVRFSKINLPSTDILTRVNLNQIFLNYWKLLKQNTNVNNVVIDQVDGDINFNENNFVSGVKNFVLNLSPDETKNMDKEMIYNEYVKTIVPKIRILFNMMKKYIQGKLSIVSVVSYLEPFLIYEDDLTYKQYQEITRFIDSQISEYNKNMIEFSRIFKIIGSVRNESKISTKSYRIIELIENNYKNEVLENAYDIDINETDFTSTEYLRKMIMKDYNKLYTTTIAVENLPLMFPKDVTEIFDTEKKKIGEELIDQQEKNTCKNKTIAKMYTSIADLEDDNNKTIYFDKRYDNTNYGVMEKNYAKEILVFDAEQLKKHITNDLMKKNNMLETDAEYLAETLIDGVKKVIDGQYALLYKGYSENIVDETDYYVRKDNQWVLDKEMNAEQFRTDQDDILCNLQEKCIDNTKDNVLEKCDSMDANELGLQNELLKNIINEFDTKYKSSKEEFERKIKEEFDYFLSILPILSKIENHNLLKNNNKQYSFGLDINDDFNNIVISPYSKLLDIILSQKDFVKKQYDIITFTNKFTREKIDGINVDGKPETEHWLYCVKTGAPLLPTFKKKLANAFIISQYEYQQVLEQIKTTNGQLSDDGDWWTDKFTGWSICKGDFDTEEGYQDGFKVTSRAVMEDDAGNNIMAQTTEKRIKYITEETITINNVVNALSVAMGINIEPQKDFIINNVIESIRSMVETESDYKEQVKKAAERGKRLPSYKDYFNTSLLYYTFGLFLIAVQTSIPSVKTRKTHPGCVRSFMGYPFEGSGNYSSLEYLSCVIYDIRQSSEPWNVLKRTKADKIQARIKAGIDDYLIQLPDVQQKMMDKAEYLLTNPTTEIPEEHDIARWSNFLPPLVPFHIKHLTNISDEFKRTLKGDLKSGSVKQREKILVVESKIIKFSLAIQEKINAIVKKHNVLLKTSNNEPYLENACCNTSENEPTVQYFIQQDKDIEEYNNIVNKLNDILDDIVMVTKPTIFYSNINTKNIYPSISNTFDEKTIYLAFIIYCKFKSFMPIPPDLLPICTSKPDRLLINPSDTIENIIQRLKEDGRNYSNDQFIRLIQLISRENILNINIDNPVISMISKLTLLLENIFDENNEYELIEQPLSDLLFKAIDTFQIAREENTKEVKDLNNYLIRTNEDMKNEIIEFVQKNSGSNITKKMVRQFTNVINQLSEWKLDNSNRENNKISNDTMYTITEFYKTFIHNFINIFPNIILNKVNYDETLIPKYYQFSESHSNRLKKYIANYFEGFKTFYGVPIIEKILYTIKKNGENMIKLAETTPCFSNIQIGDKLLKGVIDERTSRFLFENYLLRVFIQYIELCDNNDMVVTEQMKPQEEVDIYTVDYIEETETQVDLGISYHQEENIQILTGNKKQLRQKITELLIVFMKIFQKEKDILDTPYEIIQDRIFKMKEREKDRVTDRLKNKLTDEERDVDTILKISKLGPLYSKGLQKGLTVYDKNFYDEEQELREDMAKTENKLRKTANVTDENIDILMDEYYERQHEFDEIEKEAYDMEYINEDFFNGNVDGVGAPEEEYEDYADYY